MSKFIFKIRAPGKPERVVVVYNATAEAAKAALEEIYGKGTAHRTDVN